MRLFFPSASVPSRIIRSRYFFTLDVLRRMSCYFCIVTVKRGCYDRHRAPFCGFPRRENHARERRNLSLSFSLPLTELPPPRGIRSRLRLSYFQWTQKILRFPLALFRRLGQTDATVTGKRDGNWNNKRALRRKPAWERAMSCRSRPAERIPKFLWKESTAVHPSSVLDTTAKSSRKICLFSNRFHNVTRIRYVCILSREY